MAVKQESRRTPPTITVDGVCSGRCSYSGWRPLYLHCGADRAGQDQVLQCGAAGSGPGGGRALRGTHLQPRIARDGRPGDGPQLSIRRDPGGTAGAGTLQVGYGHDELADEETFTPGSVTIAGP